MTPTPEAVEKKWSVRLICCGRDAGTAVFASWREADDFRRAYTSGPGVGLPHGHDRVAILERHNG